MTYLDKALKEEPKQDKHKLHHDFCPRHILGGEAPIIQEEGCALCWDRKPGESTTEACKRCWGTETKEK